MDSKQSDSKACPLERILAYWNNLKDIFEGPDSDKNLH